MKIQQLQQFSMIAKELGLENQGQIREFYERERENSESLWQTINRYYKEYLRV